MRGMTMLLVVYSHVCHFCMGDFAMGGNDVMFLFRMPCFFFISGWLFYGVGKRHMDSDGAALSPQGGSRRGAYVWSVVRHKARVQLVPTVIFLVLLVGLWCISNDAPFLTTFVGSLGATKGGYWFTVTLFEFFLLYIIGVRGISAIVVSIAAFAYDVNYAWLVANHPLPFVYDVLGFLGVMTWRFYIFFFLGTLAHKHFDAFQRLCNSPLFLASVAVAFVGAVLLLPATNAWLCCLRFLVGGVAGMTLVFACFRWLGTSENRQRTHADSLGTKERSIWRWLRFVGTRTLDIYLLHYFFLPRQLLSLVPALRGESELFALAPIFRSCPGLPAVAVVIVVTLAVVAVCLLMSALLRRSHFLAYWLFGAKRNL